MLSVKGTYKDGKISIKEKIKTNKPMDVVVTFLEEVHTPAVKKLDLNKFSFKKAKALLAGYEGSLSDVIIKERRSAV
jgi:hypothetical protein